MRTEKNGVASEQSDDSGLRELALFAGAGGGILGGKLLGWRTVCAVEIEDYCRRVLMQRQNDGILQPFPIWDDVRTFDGRPWRGIVDVVSGGFPCQGLSAAGKGQGLSDPRSGLWFEMARVVREVRPKFVFVENSSRLVCNGLERVLSDLAEIGYDAQWLPLSGHAIGSAAKGERLWILAAAPDQIPWNKGRLGLWSANQQSVFLERTVRNEKAARKKAYTKRCRVADGVAHRMERIGAVGNGQDPVLAASAWRILGGPVG